MSSVPDDIATVESDMADSSRVYAALVVFTMFASERITDLEAGSLVAPLFKTPNMVERGRLVAQLWDEMLTISRETQHIKNDDQRYTLLRERCLPILNHVGA